MNDTHDSIEQNIIQINSKQKCDVYIFFGHLEHSSDEIFFSESEYPKHTTAILILSTYGGVPRAAYRIARRLKQQYKSFSIFIFSKCKSSGTLLSLGADEIIMSDAAEMGPLDIQLRKADELNEMSSGLTITQAMSTLRNEAFSMFEEYFLRLRTNSQNQISTKRAAEIATEITVGLLNPVYSQIDPIQLGETDRALSITAEYGQRLGSENLKPDALNKLIATYPDHGFVIDRDEAKELFKTVREPNKLETQLATSLTVISDNYIGKTIPLVLNLTKIYIKDKEVEIEGGDKNDEPKDKQIVGETALGESKDFNHSQHEEEDLFENSSDDFTDKKEC